MAYSISTTPPWLSFAFTVPCSTSFQLLSAQIECCRKIPRRAAVDIPVAMGFDLFAECLIAGHVAQLDHGLPFEWGSQSVVTVICRNFVQRIGESAFASVRPQAHIEMEDAFLFGFDPLQQFLTETFEVFTVLNAVLSVRPAPP